MSNVLYIVQLFYLNNPVMITTRGSDQGCGCMALTIYYLFELMLDQIV